MKRSTLNLIMAGACISGTIGNLGNYFTKPDLRLIDQQAKLVEQYNGPNPSDALDDALQAIGAVKNVNPDVNHLLELENDIMKYQNEAEGVSEPLVYNAILDAAADEMDKFTDKYSRSDFNLGIGIAWLGLAGAYSTLIALKKDTE